MLHVYNIDELWPDQLSRRHFPCGSDSKREGSLGMGLHTVGVKKVPIYRPYNGTGNSVPFPFNFRAVAVLVRFQTVPVLSQGQPVRSGERPVQRN